MEAGLRAGEEEPATLRRRGAELLLVEAERERDDLVRNWVRAQA